MADVLSPLHCLDISNTRKHAIHYGILVSADMFTLARTLKLTEGQQSLQREGCISAGLVNKMFLERQICGKTQEAPAHHFVLTFANKMSVTKNNI